MTTPDPFTILGLTPGPDLTGEQVSDAWRAIATATHPDREDGGDPARYAAASAARVTLRTAWGRSEAYADLTAAPARSVSARPRISRWRAVALVPARVRHGRPARLAVRITVAAVVAFGVTRTGAATPAIAGVLTGITTWLALSGRGDLAPPPGR